MTAPERCSGAPLQSQLHRSRSLCAAIAILFALGLLPANPTTLSAKETSAPPACNNNGGISLPAGFCATVFAPNIPHAGHLVVAANGVVYVNTGRGDLVALEDTSGTGRADVMRRFGTEPKPSSGSNAGVTLFKGALYAETNDRIVRYDLPSDRIAPSQPPETIVSDLPPTERHPFAIDAEGELFVAANVSADRQRAGIWRYDANRTQQAFSPAACFVTGIRDTDAIAVEHGIASDAIGLGIYVTEHRWLQGSGGHSEPEAAFPAARLLKVSRAERQRPLAAFPGQLLPSDLLLYDRHQFPSRYSGGAFIAFSASRPTGAPFPEGSGAIMFQPFAHGKPDGKLLVFAEPLASAPGRLGSPAWRPSGLASGPDGALYISDDLNGRIWRVTYRGPTNEQTAAKS